MKMPARETARTTARSERPLTSFSCLPADRPPNALGENPFQDYKQRHGRLQDLGGRRPGVEKAGDHDGPVLVPAGDLFRFHGEVQDATCPSGTRFSGLNPERT